MSRVKIKVVGVGGGGGKIISRIYNKNKSIDYVAINTDLQDLKQCKADKLLQIGKQTTKGMGAGMQILLGEKSALENIQDVLSATLPSQVIILVSCFGGGTGSGATPLIAKKIKERDKNVLLLSIITLPFSFEGSFKRSIALRSLERLKDFSDAIFVLENDNITKNLEKQATIKESFAFCDDFISKIVNSILELITSRGVINIDFIDIKNSLQNGGQVYFAQGVGEGENRIEMAISDAFLKNITSVDLFNKINKFNSVLFSVAGDNFTLQEISQISDLIKNKFGNPSKIYFGAFQDKDLRNKLKITIFACSGK